MVCLHTSRPSIGKNAIDSLILVGSKLLEIYGKNSMQENWNTTMCMGLLEVV